MPNLDRPERERLVRVLGMLASNHDGERASAALLASRILTKAGLTWDDVIVREPGPSTVRPPSFPAWGPKVITPLQLCIRRLNELTEWERAFVRSIQGRPFLTVGQHRKLTEIVAGLAARDAA